MARVYYNQTDKRWAIYPYPSPNHPNATIKSSGCGPTSAAMIVSSLNNIIITPYEMSRFFLQNNLRGAEGTRNKAFSWTAKEFGLDMIETTNIDKAIDILRSGGMVVAICAAGGVFSEGGHYIVLGYMRNTSTICVFDPYLYKGKFNTPSRKGKVAVNGNDVDITVNNFKKYSRVTRMFCYKPEKEQPKTVLAHVKTKINKAPLRNSKDHNTNKNVITHLKKGTELDILEINNEWGRAIQGYVNMNDCERQELFKAEVIVDKAPLRNSMEHNTNKNVIQHLKKGTKLSIVERHNNEWWSAPQGYVNKNDCRKI